MQAPAACDAADDIRARARECYADRRYAECIDLLIEARERSPRDAALHASLGAAYHADGRVREALDVLRRAVAIDGTCAFAHDNLAVVLSATGHFADALEHHERALALDPQSARARANYGLTLEAAGNAGAAETELRRALALDDGIAAAHSALGRFHFAREDHESAEESFLYALDLSPGLVTARIGLARVLSRTLRHADAVRRARQAVRLAPADLRAALCLAEVLAAAHRGHDALDVFRRLQRAGASGVAIDAAKASVLCDLGRYREALRLFRRVLRAEPFSSARGSYLFALHASARSSDRAVLRELQRWERYQGAPPERVRRRHRRDPDPDRRLRIGYLSPDFRQHVVRQFFEPVMLVHDADAFEFHCYSEVRREDQATAELRAVADRWYVTHGRSDAEVAARIDDDGIDVLVDLAGHTANNRLGVLTCRPAPIQATYLGYFGSTGLSAMDYWITDEVLHPPDSGECATETIHRLPRCAFCYGTPASAVAQAPAERESSQGVVFGCFNNIAKINFDVIDTWARILRLVEGSCLVLKDRGFAWGRTRHVWRRRFARRGIDPARIELQAASPHAAYLAGYRQIDIALDPFPRTGGTTTCDAIWMGVPVVTLAGRRYVERLSATKLAAVGAGELTAACVDEYVDLAVALAGDDVRRAEYHRTLQARMARSPLCDPVSLARALEDAYRGFWHEYLKQIKSVR